MNIQIEPLLDTLQLLDISDEVYFSEQYANYISNSRLRLRNEEEGGSPLLYKQGFKDQSSVNYLHIGSGVHELVLQPEYFKLEDSGRPTANLGNFIDQVFTLRTSGLPIYKCLELASSQVNYYKDKLTLVRLRTAIKKGLHHYLFKLHYINTDNRAVRFLNTEDKLKIESSILAVKQNEEIQELLHPFYILEKPISLNEQTILLDVKVLIDFKPIILKLKAKLDNFTINFDTKEVVLNDLKTSSHLVLMFNDSFQKFHYYRQGAIYLYLINLVVQKLYGFKPESLKANFLVVTTFSPYTSRVFKVTQNEIKKGWNEFTRLLTLIAIDELNNYEL